jgi:hypothetical protein
VRSQSQIAGLLVQVQLDRARAKEINQTIEPAFTKKCGAPHKFDPSWYDTLKGMCREVMYTPGFGTTTVKALACMVMVDKMQLPVEDAFGMMPSDHWCWWFMRQQMNLVQRRSSGTPIRPEVSAKQDALHLITLQRLALLIDSGLKLKYIIGSDEFGLHLFPLSDYVWREKGDQKVTADLKEDKRQYTGDVAHNMDGQIVCVHQIWGGTTDRCLPSHHKRAKYPHFHFARSPNHWANLETKIAFGKRIWDWVVDEHIRDHKEETGKDLTRAEGEAISKCVWLLDCWPVNTSKAFREAMHTMTAGRMEILYVPAGATGRFQVNDTHMHKYVVVVY